VVKVMCCIYCDKVLRDVDSLAYSIIEAGERLVIQKSEHLVSAPETDGVVMLNIEHRIFSYILFDSKKEASLEQDLYLAVTTPKNRTLRTLHKLNAQGHLRATATLKSRTFPFDGEGQYTFSVSVGESHASWVLAVVVK